MTGHATKYAAEAMMARVFLFYTGRYEKTELPNGTTKEDQRYLTITNPY